MIKNYHRRAKAARGAGWGTMPEPIQSKMGKK
jgi:hypothetical protein